MEAAAPRTVIVTGGASGIGRATAERFVRGGDTVEVWDVVEPSAGLPRGVRPRRVDVSDEAAVEAAVVALVAERGRVDVLINNAGILRDARLVRVRDGEVEGRMTTEEFDAVLGVNLRGVFLCTRAVAPHMIRAGRGVVLNAGSVVGLYGNFGQTNYAAAKAAVHTMTRTWARELGRYGIRVNAVAPGFVRTDMALSVPEAALERIVAHTPLGRMGDPSEIAAAYHWLASDEASFVHGTVLSVDGGLVVGT